MSLPCFAGTYSRCFAAQSWAAPKPHRPDLTVPLLNWQNNQVGDIVLPGSIFNVPVRKDILHRVVTWQLAKRRQVRLLAHDTITAHYEASVKAIIPLLAAAADLYVIW